MDTQSSRFDRLLLSLMIVLYVLAVAVYSFAYWTEETEHFFWIWLSNSLILSIPLLLLFGSAFVLLSAWRERRLAGQVRPGKMKVFHWAPRLAAILLILFVSLFSLDVFEMQAAPGELLVALVMHNLPSIIMLVVLAFAWWRPAVGFFAFLIGGFFILGMVIMGGNLFLLFLICLPLLLIAGMFYADWRWSQPLPPPPQDAIA